ncbi:MAG: HNH endonuclease signature motif containing protein [Desulfobacterales bacterium]
MIDHILQNGFVTTEELKEKYGYNHPPRAARDVREHGIPLITFRVTGSDGRKIAAYKFGNPDEAGFTKLAGRTALSKLLKEKLIQKHGCKCFIYLEVIEERNLQIDHRIPYEIGGEPQAEPENFMLLSGSANRAKSWSCEHCENWITIRDKSICLSCYWAYPENYSHIAMREIRRIDLLWQGEEIITYEKLKSKADQTEKQLPEFIKEILKKAMRNMKNG